MEKAQALGAASRSFAQLRGASQSAAAEIAEVVRGAFRPPALPASPVLACCVLACCVLRMRVRVRESSSEA